MKDFTPIQPDDLGYLTDEEKTHLLEGSREFLSPDTTSEPGDEEVFTGTPLDDEPES
jgi:hypothetical protein